MRFLFLLLFMIPNLAHANTEISTAATNLGIGTTSVKNALSVASTEAIGSSYVNTTAPANGLIVQGNVGIGSSNPGHILDVKGTLDFLHQGGTGNYGDASTQIKGAQTGINGYVLELLDSSGNIVDQFNTDGRLNIQNYNAAEGAVGVLYNEATSNSSMPVGHWAYGAKNDSGNMNTTGRLYNVLTSNATNSMGSYLSFDYMDNDDTSGGYTQPNKSMTLGAAGLSLPGIPITDQTGILTLSPSSGSTYVKGPNTTNVVNLTIFNTNFSAFDYVGVENVNATGYGTTGALPYASVFGNPIAEPIQFFTNNVDRVTITATGNVGIGTVVPTSLISVGGTCHTIGPVGTCWTSTGQLGYCSGAANVCSTCTAC
jgi:hypothetical protein